MDLQMALQGLLGRLENLQALPGMLLMNLGLRDLQKVMEEEEMATRPHLLAESSAELEPHLLMI
jgi:hypothetical protein